MERLAQRYQHDPYLAKKLASTYDGTLLSPQEYKSKAESLYRWLDVLETGLENSERHSQSGQLFLCGGEFGIADVSVVPRTSMFPLLGLLMTTEEARHFPLVTRYIQQMHGRGSFLAFDKIAKWVPWGFITAVGNWRSQKDHRRLDPKELLPEHLSECIRKEPALAEPSLEDSQALDEHSSPYRLYVDKDRIWPDSVAVEIAAKELGLDVATVAVDAATAQQRRPRWAAQVSPFGEVPALIHRLPDGGEGGSQAEPLHVYDAKNIVEYLDASTNEVPLLLPLQPVERCRMRMLQGWAGTCMSYQLLPLYRERLLRSSLRERFSSSEELGHFLMEEGGDGSVAEHHRTDLLHLWAQGGEASKLDACAAGLHLRFGFLEELLRSGDGKHLVGSRISSADIFVHSFLRTAALAGVAVSSQALPYTHAWHSRLAERFNLTDSRNEE